MFGRSKVVKSTVLFDPAKYKKEIRQLENILERLVAFFAISCDNAPIAETRAFLDKKAYTKAAAHTNGRWNEAGVELGVIAYKLDFKRVLFLPEGNIDFKLEYLKKVFPIVKEHNRFAIVDEISKINREFLHEYWDYLQDYIHKYDSEISKMAENIIQKNEAIVEKYKQRGILSNLVRNISLASIHVDHELTSTSQLFDDITILFNHYWLSDFRGPHEYEYALSQRDWKLKILALGIMLKKKYPEDDDEIPVPAPLAYYTASKTLSPDISKNETLENFYDNVLLKDYENTWNNAVAEIYTEEADTNGVFEGKLQNLWKEEKERRFKLHVALVESLKTTTTLKTNTKVSSDLLKAVRSLNVEPSKLSSFFAHKRASETMPMVDKEVVKAIINSKKVVVRTNVNKPGNWTRVETADGKSLYDPKNTKPVVKQLEKVPTGKKVSEIALNYERMINLTTPINAKTPISANLKDEVEYTYCMKCFKEIRS